MIVTREWLMAWSTNGKVGWTRQQWNALGIGDNPSSGWIDRIVGTEISEDSARKFEQASNREKATEQHSLFE